MKHHEKARQLIAEWGKLTGGKRPKYPRSKIKLQELSETLERYKEALRASEEAQKRYEEEQERKQGERDIKDEFDRLSKIDTLKFDLDIQTSAGELEGEALRLYKQAKNEHKREGATHVYSSWLVEETAPPAFDLGHDIDFDDNIYVHKGGHMVRSYLLTDERAKDIIDSVSPNTEFLIKIKFIRERGDLNSDGTYWAIEDGYEALRQGETRGKKTIVLSRRETEPGSLVGIDRVFYMNSYPVTVVVYGLYKIREPKKPIFSQCELALT